MPRSVTSLFRYHRGVLNESRSMLHNRKYYTKRLGKDDGKACRKIDTFFKVTEPAIPDVSTSEIPQSSGQTGDDRYQEHEAGMC